jgi:hypothetical protein
VDGEDTNFTLFNYVNEVNAEVEKLEDNITAVRKEVGPGWVGELVAVGKGRQRDGQQKDVKCWSRSKEWCWQLRAVVAGLRVAEFRV